MKFNHEFQDALLKEGFPPHWVASAVPYGQLKKVIKKVKLELEAILQDLGLDPSDLFAQDDDERGEGSVAFQYNFDGDKVFRPKLTLTFDGDTSVDASLSPDTKEFLKVLVGNRRRGYLRRPSAPSDGGLNSVLDSVDPSRSITDAFQHLEIEESRRENDAVDYDSHSVNESIRKVEIPLTFDSEFFGLLQGDVTNLDALQAGEQKAMTEEITELSKDMTRLTAPSKFAKTDMYRWRALFDIYLQAAIFFSTREHDHGSRNSTMAAQQLNWFQTEVTKQGIVQAFKLSSSRQALDRFIAINIKLLQNLKFQEINQKAIGKILKIDRPDQALWVLRAVSNGKISLNCISQANEPDDELGKDLIRRLIDDFFIIPVLKWHVWHGPLVNFIIEFDKRTQLGATNTFPKLIQSDGIMTKTMAKAVCAQVTQDIVMITPQIEDEDYTCPVCSTIVWRPIRLSCQHVLCSKCTVELQRTYKYKCPICRRKVVKEATEENIDDELIKKLKKYFPKETREKRIELETEDGIATFGPTYKHPSENTCLVM